MFVLATWCSLGLEDEVVNSLEWCKIWRSSIKSQDEWSIFFDEDQISPTNFIPSWCTSVVEILVRTDILVGKYLQPLKTSTLPF